MHKAMIVAISVLALVSVAAAAQPNNVFQFRIFDERKDAAHQAEGENYDSDVVFHSAGNQKDIAEAETSYISMNAVPSELEITTEAPPSSGTGIVGTIGYIWGSMKSMFHELYTKVFG